MTLSQPITAYIYYTWNKKIMYVYVLFHNTCDIVYKLSITEKNCLD